MAPVTNKPTKKNAPLNYLNKTIRENTTQDFSCENNDLILTLVSLTDYSFQYHYDEKIKTTVSEVHILLGLFNKVYSCVFAESVKYVVLIISVNGFLDTVKAYLLILAEEGRFSTSYNWNIFFTNLLNYFKCLMKCNYNTCSKFRKLYKKTKQSLLITKELLSELVKHKHIICIPSLLDEADKLLNSCLSVERITYVTNASDNNFWNPYPTPSEIYNNNFSETICNSYSSIEEYFKFQFLLLKQDYLCIIRDGLNQFKDEIDLKTAKKKNLNIYVFKSAVFVDFALDPTSHRKIGYKVRLEDEAQLRSVRKRKSKRFLFGSLLLFSCNNFNTFFIGLVRDRRALEEGESYLEVSLSDEPPTELINCSFTMIESSIFFEPYHQVLDCLKILSTYNYSMSNYLISDKIDLTRPKYLTLSTLYNIFGYEVSVCHIKCWPSANKLNLDQYQLEALKNALTNQFTLIQGPPGTGKTYLGLKIVEILLKNQRIWNESLSPILVICYTNHALDQFLEGVLPMTQKLVRIGGQSKSKTLQYHNLRFLWKKPFKKVESLLNLRTNIKQLIALSVASILRFKKSAELIRKNLGILHFNLLQTVMNKEHKENLYCEETFLTWLVGDYTNYRSNLLPDESEESPSDTKSNNIFFIEPEFTKYKKDLKEVEDVLSYQLNLYELESKLIELADQIECKRVRDLHPQEIKSLITNISNFLSDLSIYKLLKTQLSRGKSISSTLQEKLKNAELKTLQPSERWCLYFLWQNEVAKQMDIKFKESIVEHDNICQFFKEACDMEDYVNIKQFGTEVIGVTTTGAARYNMLLSLLKPKVVIIEEAAEILEAHTVISLTRNCQHVIMIGDHYQLRPSTASYELAKEYKLDVSLFERLVKQGMPVHTLCTQRRMRPEISSLVTPFIYKHLQNHPLVHDYPNIKGTKKNLFFINHHIYEEDVPDSHSHKNVREADFLLSLCIYFIKQGYFPSEITILTTYLAQENYMIQKRNADKLLKDVRITVVDNYQGEENNIILLSLVRSNGKNSIGYLTSRNRMCVALTRAKYGMFIAGNMDCLMEGSDLWKKVHSSLLKNDSYGDSLELVCQPHGNVTQVSLNSDMTMIKQGGCGNVCNARLPCDHLCPKMCHGNSVDHNSLKCREKCNRSCSEGHSCKLYCYEECDICDECDCIKKRSHSTQHEIQNTESHSNQVDPASFSDVHDTEVMSASDSDIDLNLECLLTVEPEHEEPEAVVDSKLNLKCSTVDPEDILVSNKKNVDACNAIEPVECNSEASLCDNNNDNIQTSNEVENVYNCNNSERSDSSADIKNVQVPSNIVNKDKDFSELTYDKKEIDFKHYLAEQVKLLMTPQEETSTCLRKKPSNINEEPTVLALTEAYKSLNISSFEISNSFYRNCSEEKVSTVMDGIEDFNVVDNSFKLSKNSLDDEQRITDVRMDEDFCSKCLDFQSVSENKELVEQEVDIANIRNDENFLESETCSSIYQNERICDDMKSCVENIGDINTSNNENNMNVNEVSPRSTICNRVLDCRHHCVKRCDQGVCETKKCEQMVRVSLPCNHISNVKCYLSLRCFEGKIVAESLMENCVERCDQVLGCGHVCQGTCSSCSQGRIHQKCTQLCDKTLICGHKCTMYCWEDEHTCIEICSNKCIHQDCSHNCKEECIVCQEKCDWACEHYVCTAPCGQLCNRPLCMLACKLLLACGHPCTGFCGEPCPPLCLECQPCEQFSPYMHRFVLLEECEHYFEWQHLLNCLNVAEISLKRCPTCGVPLWRTRRIKNILMGHNWQIHSIQKPGSTINSFNSVMKSRILQTFKFLKEFISEDVLGNSIFQQLLQYTIDNMGFILNGVKNDQRILLKSLLFIQVYLLEMSKFTTSYNVFTLRSYHRHLIFLRMNLLLTQLYQRKDINSIEFLQFECESLKIHRMAEFFILYEEYSRMVKQFKNDTDVQELCSEAFLHVKSIRSYNLTDDEHFFDIICRFKKSIGSSLSLTVDTRMFKEALKCSLLPIFTQKQYHKGSWFLCPKAHPFQQIDLYNNQCNSCL